MGEPVDAERWDPAPPRRPRAGDRSGVRVHERPLPLRPYPGRSTIRCRRGATPTHGRSTARSGLGGRVGPAGWLGDPRRWPVGPRRGVPRALRRVAPLRRGQRRSERPFPSGVPGGAGPLRTSRRRPSPPRPTHRRSRPEPTGNGLVLLSDRTTFAPFGSLGAAQPPVPEPENADHPFVWHSRATRRAKPLLNSPVGDPPGMRVTAVSDGVLSLPPGATWSRAQDQDLLAAGKGVGAARRSQCRRLDAVRATLWCPWCGHMREPWGSPPSSPGTWEGARPSTQEFREICPLVR